LTREMVVWEKGREHERRKESSNIVRQGRIVSQFRKERLPEQMRRIWKKIWRRAPIKRQ
jgi:hypothetical protein